MSFLTGITTQQWVGIALIFIGVSIGVLFTIYLVWEKRNFKNKPKSKEGVPTSKDKEKKNEDKPKKNTQKKGK